MLTTGESLIGVSTFHSETGVDGTAVTVDEVDYCENF
jgi:hypothetical protein